MARSSALFLLALSGCATWTHAPGWEAREALPVTTVSSVTGRMCAELSLCDRVGRRGELDVTLRAPFVSNQGARERSAFTIAYDGLRVVCDHPGASGHAFTCVGTGEGSPSFELFQGCTRGALATREGSFSLESDVVDLGGLRFPGRELSVRDASGRVVALLDRTSGGYQVHGPPRERADLARLHPSLEVLVTALGVLLDSGSTPTGCVASE